MFVNMPEANLFTWMYVDGDLKLKKGTEDDIFTYTYVKTVIYQICNIFLLKIKIIGNIQYTSNSVVLFRKNILRT